MLLIYWVVFFLAVAETGVQLLLPPYLTSTGVAVASVGFLMALLAAGRLGSRLAGAHLYGRESRRRVLLAVLAAVSLSALPFAFSLPAALSGLTLFVHGLSYGLATTMTLALCMERIERPSDAAAIMGWYTGFTSGGHFVGAVVAGYLADRWGVGPSFVAIALTTGISLPLMAGVKWPDLVKKGRVVVGRGHRVTEVSGSGILGGAEVAEGQRDSAAATAAPAEGDMESSAGGGRAPRLISLLRTLPAPVYLAVLLAFYINFLNQITNAFYPIFALQMGLSLTIVGSLKG
ncbi:MAG TPA: MFS transporter, partial [Thermoleophilia bacterium]|nr:MFS transporter [Thermoleophilia bacterium]